VTAFSSIERDVLILACAISAGVHTALTPTHFAESFGAGLGFLGASVFLVAFAGILRRKATEAVLLATVALLSGLLGSYALAIMSGVPLLHSEPEPVTGLALLTKAVEIVGLLAASHLLRRGRPAVAATYAQSKGRLS
jgi:hypothetical protein